MFIFALCPPSQSNGDASHQRFATGRSISQAIRGLRRVNPQGLLAGGRGPAARRNFGAPFL
jgi:hypothetical protein